MATIASPYGLVPVRKADGTPYAGARDAFLIDPAGVAERIGYGSIVILANGYVSLSLKTGSASGDTNNFGGTANNGALGVFVGCEYINGEGQLIFSQFYPEGTLNATAYIVTDPGVTFQAQANGALAQVTLGQNVPVIAQTATGSVSITTGKSNLVLNAAGAADAAKGLKVVGFSTRGTSEIGDAFTDVLVKFNFAFHQFGTGNATA
jgi:hypothetical protein